MLDTIETLSTQFVRTGKEIFAVPEVRDAWELEDNETPDDFSGMVYAAKFKFVSGSPAIASGPFYLDQGDRFDRRRSNGSSPERRKENSIAL